ncbi:endolytic transglycosylase MltG [Peptostreptococcaceae bacterium AGR-M142]
MKKILLLLCAVIFISSFLLFNYYNNSLKPIDENDLAEYLIDIKMGSSFNEAARELEQKDVIKNAFTFKIFAKNEKLMDIKAGKYRLYRSMDVKEILNILNEGKVYIKQKKVTIPEGYNLKQIAKKLSESNIVDEDEFIKKANDISSFNKDYKFLNEKNINSLEGFLFPDTYEFPLEEDEEIIIKIMLNRFNNVFKEEYYQVLKERKISINELVTMASIVEREAKKDEERPLISAVFYNRLDINMKLQSCATVQYLLPEIKPRLLNKDLEIESPYNTYKYKGLPPGPISCPGEKSINAALYPSDVDYLFFVAKKDGSHTFTKTLRAHNNAKRKNLNR